jgi:hypothetical protein
VRAGLRGTAGRRRAGRGRILQQRRQQGEVRRVGRVGPVEVEIVADRAQRAAGGLHHGLHERGLRDADRREREAEVLGGERPRHLARLRQDQLRAPGRACVEHSRHRGPRVDAGEHLRGAHVGLVGRQAAHRREHRVAPIGGPVGERPHLVTGGAYLLGGRLAGRDEHVPARPPDRLCERDQRAEVTGRARGGDEDAHG